MWQDDFQKWVEAEKALGKITFEQKACPGAVQASMNAAAAVNAAEQGNIVPCPRLRQDSTPALCLSCLCSAFVHSAQGQAVDAIIKLLLQGHATAFSDAAGS